MLCLDICFYNDYVDCFVENRLKWVRKDLRRLDKMLFF